MKSTDKLGEIPFDPMPEGCREIYQAQGEKREGVCHQGRDVHTLEEYHHASDGECAVYIELMHIIGL